MSIQWSKDIDSALSEAHSKQRAALADFNAAPM